MESNLQNFQRVYQMLEDEKSKDIFLNRLNYLISHDTKYVQRMIPNNLKCTGTVVDFPDVLSAIPSDGRIILYGAGAMPHETFEIWSHDKRVIGFCSNNIKKQEKGYLGYPVISPEKLLQQKDYYVIISVGKQEVKAEIQNLLDRGGYPKEKIYCLNVPEADSSQYFAPGIIQFVNDEIFIDAGSFDLGTSIEISKRCASLKKIYAFEPDPINYKCCLEKKLKSQLDNVKLLPAGTWSSTCNLFFDSGRMLESKITETQTDLSIQVVAIDDIIEPGDKVTFIKMDVEGAELESLKGAKNVIQRDKPKLAISIYHKPEDMVQIPLYIKRLVPEYRLYIRHHSVFESETVLYAIP